MNAIPPLLKAALACVRDGRLDDALDAIADAEAVGIPAHLSLAARGAVEMRRHVWADAERYFNTALSSAPDEFMLYMKSRHGPV